MGSTSSKFKKYLQHGDEFAAMQIYQSSPELRKNLDPNLSYGENHNHNTALHYAAKHGMKHLLRTFLNDLGGNPNKKNGLNESVLLCACQLNQTKSFSAQERRAACVQLLLYWKGAAFKEGGREKVDLSAQDKEGNTALHWAAFNGLKKCVELLLAHGAPLFIENNDKMTPCDLAMKGSNHEIARFLESRMVFADNSDVFNEDELMVSQEEVYSGLRSQDLQEAKDQLLVDTSDMLKIPLFTAEALLRNNEWSRELLLEKWMKDPIECCHDAGVQAPSTFSHQGNSWDSPNCTSPTLSENAHKIDKTCEICLSSLAEKDKTIFMSCKHIFCKTCWENYLTIKIQGGDAHHIMCPAYQCYILVPVELIEKLVTPEMARRYLQFDIKAFVESSKCIKWCPVAGCGRAVRLPETEQNRSQESKKSIPMTSHAVDCGNSHFFCWECLGEAHAPCGCDQWQEWHKKIAQIEPEEQKSSCNETEDAANCLWLVTNSKPCPNCKSPIQKNEGCNHMKCSKCKFDFCWVCQESWKKHSSATGGYFRCNRFEAVSKADERQVALISEAIERNNKMQEMSRFLHFYTRFRNHENSQKLEEPLLRTAHQKMEILANNLGFKYKQEHQITKDAHFFEEGVRELLKARRVLCGSYVYGYYLQDEGCNKSIFEFMQNELEEVTEKLSEMIARPYLRTPKSVIIQTTALARRKRHEFVRAVAQGLIPPETPPSQRKVKKTKFNNMNHSPVELLKRNMELVTPLSEDDLHCLENSFQENCSQLNEDNHCELRCNRQSYSKVGSDYNLELVIALEMSRLQMIEDRLKQSNTTVTPDVSSSNSNNSSESNDDQLKLAIQLSLQESSGSFNNLSEEETSWSGRQYFSQSNADITVDYFLKTLANHQFDLKSLRVDFNMLRNDAEEIKNEREYLFKPCNGNEDGRFQISDIHENGFVFANDEEFESNDTKLKRSHSTGDLMIRRSSRRLRTRVNRDESRYHLDSDHSSQHDDRPEEVVRKNIKCPSSLHHNRHSFTNEEKLNYEVQNSIEDTTTDSIKADMEVCEILENVTDVDLKNLTDENTSRLVKEENIITEQEIKTESISQPLHDSKFHNPFASLKAKLCSSNLSKSYCLTKLAVNKSIGLLQDKGPSSKIKKKSLSNSIHANVTLSKSDTNAKTRADTSVCKTNFSKSTSFLHETRNDCNFQLKNFKQEKRFLETDSSNEYESETGIPRSPTLFISGVSISRTPEPKSPRLGVPSIAQQSRSSSLSGPLSCNTSNNSLNNLVNDLSSSVRDVSYNIRCSRSQDCSPKRSFIGKENAKSKSANEPEREREVFKFPKSSTDGALSSVLHVQESNLSSDDFHEALFLLEKSPKTRDSRRKKRSKKKEKDDRREEASSAL